MKQLLILFIIVLCPLSLFSQISFVEHEISAESSGFKSFRVADIDNDGDFDVVVLDYNSVDWFENINGQGDFGALHNIYTHVYYDWTVESLSWDCLEIGDFDNNNSVDVLYGLEIGSNGDLGLFIMYNNNGVFSSEDQSIAFIYNGYEDIFIEDIDDDGDLDLITSSHAVELATKYIENTGSGFSSVSIEAPPGRFASLDYDNNGETDLFLSWGPWLYLYTNINGSDDLNNDNQQIIDEDSEEYYDDTILEDINGDGDRDIISKIRLANNIPALRKIIWHENINGIANIDYTQENNILSGQGGIRDFFIKDVDGDNDLDIIFSKKNENTTYGQNENSIYWNENIDGLGSFSESQLIIADVENLFLLNDINDDGLIDIVCTKIDEQLVWLENTTSLSVNENSLSQFSIYPNPTTGYLNIEYPKELMNITVFNQIGQKVLTFYNTKTVDISSLSNGMYFVKLKAIDGATTTKKVVKN